MRSLVRHGRRGHPAEPPAKIEKAEPSDEELFKVLAEAVDLVERNYVTEVNRAN